MDSNEEFLRIVNESLDKAKECVNRLIGRMEAEKQNKYASSIIYLDGELILKGLTSDFKAVKGDTMPPRYADGTFRDKKYCKEYRFMHNGKQYSVGGKTEEICYQKRTELIAGKIKTKNAPIITYGQWLDEWNRLYNNKIKDDKNKSLNEDYIKRIKEKLGDIKLSSLSGIDIQNYLIGITAENTRDKIYLKIKASLRMAHALGKIKLNPCAAVSIEKHVPEKHRALTFKEQQDIYEALNNKYKPLYFFCCCTGLRISEVLELSKSDIDFDGNIIYSRRKKKRGKANVYPIPYLPELLDFYKNTDLIFDGYTYNGFKKHLEDVLKKLNIKDISIHCFRHTFASNCYSAGISDKQIQEWLAHETLAMTTDTYTHLIKKGTSILFEYIKKLKNSP